MIQRCVFIVGALVFGLPAFSQPLPGNGGNAGAGLNLADHQLIMAARKYQNGEPEEKVEGTPYLIEEFVSAKVYSSKGKYNAVPMRYNMFKDYVEFKQKEATYVLDPGPDIQKLDFGTYSLVVEKYEVKGKVVPGFFTLLDSGKLTIVVKKAVTYKAAEGPKAIETEPTPAKYIRAKDEFMYKVGDSQLMELSSVKKLIDALPDKQEELKTFASKEKISKNEAELTKLARYYNSLP